MGKYMNRKIYCAFCFFNELELLKIKLEELYDAVDYFVISEADVTHSGISKPFYFYENRKMFDKYKNKIIYQAVQDTPNDFSNLKYDPGKDDLNNLIIQRVSDGNWWDHTVSSYGRDTFQKESLIKPLIMGNVSDDDLVILGDLDEIPKASVVKQIAEEFDDDEIFHLQHRFCWYYLNVEKVDEIWYGNIMTSLRRFKEISFCEMRIHKKGNFIPDAGWHFTYQNGLDAIKTKIESWGEQPLNLPQVKDNIAGNVENCLTSNHDLFFRSAKFEKIPINYVTMPEYVVNHQNEFSHMIRE